MYILFSVIFAGKLVSSVNMKLSYTGKCIFSLLCMWTLLVDWLPARASEQGNVIGSVRIYIYICVCAKKNCN